MAVAILLGVDGSPWLVSATEQAVRVERRQVAPDPSPPTTAPEGSACGQWYALAMEEGWTDDEWPVLDYVMHRESRCQEGAVGSVPVHGRRALGLTQLLGWSCPPAGCLDARSNLRRARELWEQLGWHPWCLRGDPMTGSC